MIATEILGIQLTLLGVVSFQLFEITNGVSPFFIAGIVCVAAGLACTFVGIATDE